MTQPNMNQSKQPPYQSEEAHKEENKAQTWAEENADLIKAYNAMIEKYGLPLEKYRAF